MNIAQPIIDDSANPLARLQSDLQALLAAIKSETGVPGIGIALSIDGRHITANVGHIAIDADTPLSSDARFQLGCITKLLTCMIASCLIDEGRLDKEAVIGHYLPELKDTDKGTSIAVWQLMSHTSGYQGLNIADPAIAYYYTWPKLIEFLQRSPQLFEPGSVFSYEHSEHVLLGEILQRISHQPLTELFEQRIFKPLGLNVGTIKEDQALPEINVADHAYDPATQAFIKLKSIPFGHFWKSSLSDWTMTLLDQVRLAEAIAGFTQSHNSTDGLPSRSAMEFVQKQVIKLPTTFGGYRPEQLPAAFGVGCAVYRGWLLGHNGSARGQTCGLRFDPRNKVALAVGINSWQPFLRDSIINHIFAALRGQPLPAAPQNALDFQLDQLIGTYVGPQGSEFTVTLDGSQLLCCLGTGISSQRLEVTLEKTQQGALALQSDAQHHSLGFFPNPNSGEPCLMWGLTAFRKQH